MQANYLHLKDSFIQVSLFDFVSSCLLRVIDTFGTEPAFNYEPYARGHGLKTAWGMLNLNPQQFYTMFRMHLVTFIDCLATWPPRLLFNHFIPDSLVACIYCLLLRSSLMRLNSLEFLNASKL